MVYIQLFSGSALQGTTPASGWARAGAGSWAIQLPHFQFKVMLKKRKQQVRARFAPRSLSGRPRSIGSVAFNAQPILTIFFLPQQERLGPGTYNIRDFLQETQPSSLRGICDTREQRFRESRRVRCSLTWELLASLCASPLSPELTGGCPHHPISPAGLLPWAWHLRPPREPLHSP